MNDNGTTIDRDAPNSSSEPSSSSSSQSDDSSATTSSSSQSSSSEATSIEATGERVSKPTTMLDTDGSISSSSSSSNKSNHATIISSESVRRYKNSPFGLGRHHFLTMPAADLEPTTANQGNNPRGAQRSARRDWKKRRPADPYRNLSLIAPVFASASQSPLSSPSWRNLTAEQKQNKITTTTTANHGDGARGANHVEPAYDAGLDAERCNSKASRHPDDYFAADSSRQVAGAGTTASPVGGKGSSLAADEKAEDYDCLLVRFSSIMYATFLVILGCILHCSELRQKSKNSTDHIYTIIVALMGIAWLLFLQGDLHRYKRYASKYILIETIFNDHRQKLRQLSIDSPADSAARSTASSAASLINDRMSMNTEVIFKKTAYKMYQRRAAALNNHLPSPDNCSTLDLPFQMSSKARNFLRPNEDKASNKQASGKRIESDAAVAENLVPAYKFLHGKMGANFYLKCGMAAFCFGHVIHEGLRFGQQLYFFGTGNLHCRDSVALIAHLITPLYSFYQLFMMFKYSNLVINRYRVLAKFGLMHIVGTSVTFWIRTILEEAYEDFVHKMDYFKSHKLQIGTTNSSSTSVLADPSLVAVLQSALSSAIATEASERSEQQLLSNRLPANNITTTVAQSIWALMSSPISATITPQIARQLPESYACAQNTLLTTKSMNALPYLYPFTIEYNLLLAATFLSLYFNIGKIGSHGTSGACQLPSIGCHPGGGFVQRVRHQSGSSSSFTNSPVSSSHHQESCDNVSTSKGAKDLGEYKSNFVVNADCHSANKGLFCGFFVLLVTLVTIVIFFVTINKPTHVQLGIKINLIQEGVLTTLILIVMVIGFKQVSKLNRNPFLRDKVTTDDVLMLIPLPFFFFHSLLSFRAETASLYQSMPIQSPLTSHEPARIHSININSNNQVIDITNTKSNSHMNRLVMSHRNISNGQLIENFINDTSGKTDIRGGDHNNRKGMGSSNINAGNDSSQIDHFKLINVALNIVVMIEVLVQTNFIIDGMRRCSESRYLRFKKPGRELITFAILLNITYWIVATFETKSVEQYKPEIEYYGPLPYMFISHTTLPVMLFYRYHSSVCLAEIWNRAYKPPKRR